MTVTEWHGRELPPLARDDHLLRPVLDWVARQPERPVYGVRVGGRIVEITAREAFDRVVAIARGLVASGVEPGDRVALMSRSRMEWVLADLAIVAAGGVTVPIYETSSDEQMQWILSDSGAVALIVETPQMRRRFAGLAVRTPDCRDAFTIDDGGLDELARRGETVDRAVVEERIAALRADAIATIIYTSGTTGRPKGCVLTHGNLRANVVQNLDALGTMVRHDDRSLLFMPLAHSLAKGAVLFGIEYGMQGVFATDIAHLPEEFPIARPTVIVAVPRIFEKTYHAARQHAGGRAQRLVFDAATAVAIQWSRERQRGRIMPWTALARRVLDPLVYHKLRAALGGELRIAFCGGAPLGERLTSYFDGVGLRIFEGYGLTETSPTLTLNRADAWRPGTVGPPVAGTTIRIAADGEILVRGPQVFGGYWHDEASTAAAIDADGWFHTGDIGVIDDDGFVSITGRKKDLIITAAGKNVAPAPLEDRLRAHALVSDAMVVGDGRPFVAALLTIDVGAVREWAAEHGLGDIAPDEVVQHQRLHEELQAAIDDANSLVSQAESIRAFSILPREWTVDEGELTPTLKVRRNVVAAHFSAELEALYTRST